MRQAGRAHSPSRKAPRWPVSTSSTTSSGAGSSRTRRTSTRSARRWARDRSVST